MERSPRRRRHSCAPPRWRETWLSPSASSTSSPRSGRRAAWMTDRCGEIRTLKARMESERLPRGADRKTHFAWGTAGSRTSSGSSALGRACSTHTPTPSPDHLDDEGLAAQSLGLVSTEHAADLSAALEAPRPRCATQGPVPPSGARRRPHRQPRRRRDRAHPWACPGARDSSLGALPSPGSRPGPPTRPSPTTPDQLRTPVAPDLRAAAAPAACA